MWWFRRQPEPEPEPTPREAVLIIPKKVSAAWLHQMIAETTRLGGTIRTEWREGTDCDDELIFTFDFITDRAIEFKGQQVPAGSHLTMSGQMHMTDTAGRNSQ